MPGDVEEILDSDRNPMKRSAFQSRPELAVRLSRLTARAVAEVECDGEDGRLPAVEQGEGLVEKLLRTADSGSQTCSVGSDPTAR
jgi:hypothetical protein